MTVVHVDDFVVAATDMDLIEDFIRYMEKAYVVSVTREVEHFLGLHVTELPGGQRLVSQPGLLAKLVQRHQSVASSAKLPTVPMATTFSEADQDDSPRCDIQEFMELLGGLVYTGKTRADGSYSISRLSMRTQKSTVKDFTALLRVLAYLWRTKERGILLTPLHAGLPRGKDGHVELEAWCDASYATHPDGKSHTGYGFKLAHTGSGLFYARSTKQANVALSSTEAELNAAVECVKDVVWFRQLMTDLGFPPKEPTKIYVDNASLIVLSTEFSGNHKRVKHFLVRLNFLIDMVENGVVIFEKVSTTRNIVDPLTKPLGPSEFTPKTDDMLGSLTPKDVPDMPVCCGMSMVETSATPAGKRVLLCERCTYAACL